MEAASDRGADRTARAGSRPASRAELVGLRKQGSCCLGLRCAWPARQTARGAMAKRRAQSAARTTGSTGCDTFVRKIGHRTS